MRGKWLLLLGLCATAPGCSGNVLAPFRAPPEVSISVESAVARVHHATIVWRVENGSAAPYGIERRNGDEPWKRLTSRSVEGGRIVLEDPSVQPGQRYSYRLRLGSEATSGTAGEVTLQIPR